MRAGIPTFRKFAKRRHRIYKHKEIASILDYLSKAELTRGAIAKLHKDTGIPESTLRDWHKRRTQPGNANWFPGAVDIDYDHRVDILVRCWNVISGENIRMAWRLPGLARAVASE
jgi:hypothetical protein